MQQEQQQRRGVKAARLTCVSGFPASCSNPLRAHGTQQGAAKHISHRTTPEESRRRRRPPPARVNLS
ncbi:hypothetical protein LSTR_LSTR000704 [Laodelphax striatellus]|uniref:Uncharacterized protein n=1 Tax=Laodelphax striatellus TaxID=195883 RepID=A0A482X4C8_LAOST|nr:hypothetical protein LSTR_LSTR016666 [Laodelphax striatellus]RZF44752.1 hypothetical protein LSTR_LSTR000704 [Laodelphax striatellus]